MFCPLCKAEYREGFTVCSSCRATLVPGDAEDTQLNPPQLAWMTHDRPAFERVAAQLGEGGIPCREVSQGDHWFYAIARKQATFTLFIFERDAEAAKQLSGVEFQKIAPKPQAVALQRCPLCQAEFPAGEVRCPSCGADLLAWVEGEDASETGDDSAGTPTQEAMESDAPELVWRGSDPVTYSRALLALREAGITFVPSPNFDHMAFGFAIPRPRQQIRASHSDSARARELLGDLQDPFPLLPQEPALATDVEELSEAPPQASESTDASATLEADVQITTEFERRRSSLRWGVGLYYGSFFLGIWVMNRLDFGQGLRAGFEDLRTASLNILFAVSAVCIIAALGFLFRSWGRRADKMGLLSCLVGLYCWGWFFWLMTLLPRR